MPSEKLIIPTRIRTTEGRFGFVPHRFLRGGFWDSCSLQELVLYFLLSLVGNRFGVSFYGNEKLACLCRTSMRQLEDIRAGLKAKDLAAFDGECIQLLSLPESPVVWMKLRPEKRADRSEPVNVAEALHAFVLDLKRRNR